MRPFSLSLRVAVNMSPLLVFLAIVIGVSPTAKAEKAKPCTLESLPERLQVRLKADYPSWTIQTLSNLSKTAKERWQGEKAFACPGIAVGMFKNSRLSHAVLLVPIEKPDAAYRLIIFTQGEGAAPDSFETADQWDKGSSANYFIRGVTIAKVFSADWVRKLRVDAKDGVMSIDAGESEYGVDVYFWANGKYQHEPIDE